MQRRFIIAAFADILGFMAWRRRTATTPEVAEPFLDKFYNEMERFVDENDHLHFKYLGDGMMVIKEINDQADRMDSALLFLEKIRLFTSHLQKIVEACDYPSPQGFRTRVTSGYVSKRMVTDPNDRQKKIPEFIGHAVNLAQRILEISPNTPFICDESIITILGPKKKKFNFKRLANPTERPRGLDISDLEGLWCCEL